MNEGGDMKNLAFLIKTNLIFLVFSGLLFTTSCSENIDTGTCPEMEKGDRDLNVPFPTLTIGTQKTGIDLLRKIREEKFLVDQQSVQSLSHPNFPIAKEESEVAVIILSLFDLGFEEDALVSFKDILEKGKEFGYAPCPPEVAVQLRLQFTDQPNYGVYHGFFIATEENNWYADGIPQIFSIVRDDTSPHPETNIGLWLNSNALIENTTNNTDQDRLFNSLNPEDYCGRFAFIIPHYE